MFSGKKGQYPPQFTVPSQAPSGRKAYSPTVQPDIAAQQQARGPKPLRFVPEFLRGTGPYEYSGVGDKYQDVPLIRLSPSPKSINQDDSSAVFSLFSLDGVAQNIPPNINVQMTGSIPVAYDEATNTFRVDATGGGLAQNVSIAGQNAPLEVQAPVGGFVTVGPAAGAVFDVGTPAGQPLDVNVVNPGGGPQDVNIASQSGNLNVVQATPVEVIIPAATPLEVTGFPSVQNVNVSTQSAPFEITAPVGSPLEVVFSPGALQGVDIAAQSIDVAVVSGATPLNVATALGTNLSVTFPTAQEITIAGQSGPLQVEFAPGGAAQDVNIASQAAPLAVTGSGTFEVVNPTVGNLRVDIANQSDAAPLNVSIAAQTSPLTVETAAGTPLQVEFAAGSFNDVNIAGQDAPVVVSGTNPFGGVEIVNTTDVGGNPFPIAIDAPDGISLSSTSSNTVLEGRPFTIDGVTPIENIANFQGVVLPVGSLPFEWDAVTERFFAVPGPRRVQTEPGNPLEVTFSAVAVQNVNITSQDAPLEIATPVGSPIDVNVVSGGGGGGGANTPPGLPANSVVDGTRGYNSLEFGIAQPPNTVIGGVAGQLNILESLRVYFSGDGAIDGELTITAGPVIFQIPVIKSANDRIAVIELDDINLTNTAVNQPITISYPNVSTNSTRINTTTYRVSVT